MVSFPGIRETFCLEEVNFDYVRTARHLHMSSYYIQPALRPGCPKLFRWAKEAGMSTSLDPDCDPSGKWNGGIQGVLENVDLFLPNEQEAMAVAGAKELGAALTFLRRLAKITIVKRSRDGVLLASEQKTFAVPAFEMHPLDTTGAGDSFNAGFVYQFLQGASLQECATWGNACGALSTQALGGTAGFPSPEQVRQFLSERGVEVRRMMDAFKTP